MQMDIKFVDFIRTVFSYENHFQKEYKITFVDVSNADIATHMLSSNFLSKGSH